jgi:hypothetical protein
MGAALRAALAEGFGVPFAEPAGFAGLPVDFGVVDFGALTGLPPLAASAGGSAIAGGASGSTIAASVGMSTVAAGFATRLAVALGRDGRSGFAVGLVSVSGASSGSAGAPRAGSTGSTRATSGSIAGPWAGSTGATGATGATGFGDGARRRRAAIDQVLAGRSKRTGRRTDTSWPSCRPVAIAADPA